MRTDTRCSTAITGRAPVIDDADDDLQLAPSPVAAPCYFLACSAPRRPVQAPPRRRLLAVGPRPRPQAQPPGRRRRRRPRGRVRGPARGLLPLPPLISNPVELPFGGFKKSGHGREKGYEALYEYSQVKTVAIKYGK